VCGPAGGEGDRLGEIGAGEVMGTGGEEVGI